MRKINPTCPVCSARSTKHGTTSKQRPRWRCTTCGHTFTRPNTNATEAARFKLFITWLTTSTTLTELAKQHHVSRRTLTRWFTTYWFITPPTTTDPYRIYPQLFIDGTYIGGSCLLIAADPTHAVSWYWCHTENSTAYQRLFDQITQPEIITTDGAKGALKAINTCWPDIKIQRCLIHIKRNIHRATGLNPTTDIGKALRRLSLDLLKITTPEQAITWLKQLQLFDTTYKNTLNQKTYRKDVPAEQVPTTKQDNKVWWYTHYQHCQAYRLLIKLAQSGHLFTYLDNPEHTDLRRETNSLEGGFNSTIKGMMYYHRALSKEHQRIACDWWLYLHTLLPDDPVKIARQQNWGRDALAKAQSLTNQLQQEQTTAPGERPATYDNGIDVVYTHSIGIRKGPMR